MGEGGIIYLNLRMILHKGVTSMQKWLCVNEQIPGLYYVA